MKADEAIKMDSKRLIAEVYKRPALWNQRNASYQNRFLTNRIWNEISLIFKLPKTVLKTKWKGLRDTFRAELKKELYCQRNNYERHRPMWNHFKSLEFLKDQMIPKTSVWDLRKVTKEVSSQIRQPRRQAKTRSQANENENTHNNSSVAGINSNLYIQKETTIKEEPNDDSDSADYQIISPSIGENENETMLQNLSPEQVLFNVSNGIHRLNENVIGDGEFNLINESSKQNYNENYHFLMSLLPHMQQLTRERRMFISMKIQKLVYDEVYKRTAKEDPSTDGQNKA